MVVRKQVTYMKLKNPVTVANFAVFLSLETNIHVVIAAKPCVIDGRMPLALEYSI